MPFIYPSHYSCQWVESNEACGSGEQNDAVKENCSSPSLPLAVERGDQRSEVGVSQPAVHWRQCDDVNAACRGLTRSLLRSTTLSFASKKEGREI